jgi:hypothetical protein
MVLILKAFFDHSGRAAGLQGAQNMAPRSSSRCRLMVVFLFFQRQIIREMPPLVSAGSSWVDNSSGRRDSGDDHLKSSSL